jgi:hypothetical protein
MQGIFRGRDVIGPRSCSRVIGDDMLIGRVELFRSGQK